MRLLIVEDTKSQRDVLGIRLQERYPRLEISMAVDGEAGLLAALNQRSFDCIITDLQMPGMSGVQMAKHLYNQGFRVPIFLWTGAPDEVSKEEASYFKEVINKLDTERFEAGLFQELYEYYHGDLELCAAK